MFLREITLRNLLSFGPETPPFALRNLNVLIGPNGSGKSNFIEAIGLLQAAPTDIAQPMREGGGAVEWLYKGDKSEDTTIEVVTTGFYFEKICHRLAFGLTHPSMSESFLVHKEHVSVWPKIGGDEQVIYSDEGSRSRLSRNEHLAQQYFVGQFDLDQSILAQLAGYSMLYEALNGRAAPPDGAVGMHVLESGYKKIRIFKDWGFGFRCPVRRPEGTEEKWDYLSPRFDNLAAVLSDLKTRPAVKRRILEVLNDFYEGITDFNVVNRNGSAYLYLEEESRTIPASRLSDGTLRFLCLVAILCHPEPPPLICIEEPELGMHPDALLAICKLIEGAAERTQLIITTHSEFIVDYFTFDPEAIVVCEKGEKGTTMQRLDAEKLSVWLEDYSLGDLWTRGQIGGNRW